MQVKSKQQGSGIYRFIHHSVASQHGTEGKQKGLRGVSMGLALLYDNHPGENWLNPLRTTSLCSDGTDTWSNPFPGGPTSYRFHRGNSTTLCTKVPELGIQPIAVWNYLKRNLSLYWICTDFLLSLFCKQYKKATTYNYIRYYKLYKVYGNMCICYMEMRHRFT